MSQFARIVRQSGLYAFGNIAVKLSGLVLTPLYLNEAFLTVGEFGHLVLLEAAAQISIAVVSLGLTTGLLKFMSDPGFRAQQPAIPFTTLATSAASALLFLALAWAAAPRLAGVLARVEEPVLLVRLLALYVAFKVVAGVPYMRMRSEERAGAYAAGTLAETLVLLGAAYYFVAVRRIGLEGILWAWVLSSGAGAVILAGSMLARVSWRLEARLVGRLVRFGAPLALSGLALPLLHTGDRFLLEWLAETEDVSVYGYATKLSGVLNMLLVQSFQLAFAVIGLKTIGEEGDAPRLYRRTFRHYAIGTTWAALGLSLFAYDATLLFRASPVYRLADPMVLPLSLGFVAYGLYAVVVNVLVAAGNTRQVTASVLAATLTNLALNLILIPLWQGYGAAVATLLSYGVLLGVADLLARRRMHVAYPWGTFLAAALFAFGLDFLGRLTLDWPTLPRLAARAGLLGVYPLLVLLAGLYARDELRKGWEGLRAGSWRRQNPER